MSKSIFEHYCELYYQKYGGLSKTAADDEPKLELPARALYTLLGALAGMRLGPMLGLKGDEDNIFSTLAGGTLGLFAPDIMNVLSDIFGQASKAVFGAPKATAPGGATDLGKPTTDVGKALEAYEKTLKPRETAPPAASEPKPPAAEPPGAPEPKSESSEETQQTEAPDLTLMPTKTEGTKPPGIEGIESVNLMELLDSIKARADNTLSQARNLFGSMEQLLSRDYLGEFFKQLDQQLQNKQ